MTKNKLKLYILQIILIIILLTFLKLSITSINSRYVLAIILCVYSLFIKFLIERNNQLDIKTRKITKVIIITAFLYVILFYILGIYSGFYKSPYDLSFNTLLKYIIPTILIVVSGEYIRFKFISVETKISSILNFIIGVLIEIGLYIDLYAFDNLDQFLLSFGYLFLAAIANNLLYNYISKRFGYKPVIYYRLITILYLYIIPIIPDVYIFFESFLKMFFPIIVYYIVDDDYIKGKMENGRINKKDKKVTIVSTACFVTMVLLIMIVSCEFKYGALVIGSGSMSGTIEKGDVIVYADASSKDLDIGDIIVFKSDQIKIVHRVVDVAYKDNDKIFYTKGDNNQSKDEGYVTDADIYGKVILTVPKIGLPTLYLHELFIKKD